MCAKKSKQSPAPTPAPEPAAPTASTPPPAAATPETPPAPESRKIRYALVGLGHIAQAAVLPGFAQAANSELAALVSGDAKKLKELQKKHPTAKTYTYEKFDECLADPAIDAVYIALPNDLHIDCALRAFAAGKHVLCEKPLAMHARDARQMIEAAAEHGVKLMTAYRLHYEPATLATLELVRSGRLGEPRYFSSTFSYQVTDPDNIRLSLERGGGPVYDIGTYCINAARHLMGEEPVEVAAMLARSDDSRFDEVEETAAVILRFPRGRLASFVVSFGAGSASRCEFVGTKGRVILEPAFEYSEALKQTVVIDDKPEEKSFVHTDQFGGEIEAFSQCILEDREPPSPGQEGLADVRIIKAIFAAARRGCTIRLSPLEPPVQPSAAQVKLKPAIKPPEPVHADSPHD
jgi:glucose-fructose oxidoreductase